MSYPKILENLIQQFMQFPGIGRRSAERMVFWLLDKPEPKALDLSKAIIDLKQNLRFCEKCNNLAESSVCLICDDVRRDHHTICVVEDPKHLLAIEKTGIYKGIYFVLLGAIAPAEGRGPDDLNIQKLIDRIKEENVTEVVIATDPDTEGEMTAIHIANQLKPLGLKIFRIGLGIPVGSSVEFADLSTLTMSMASRREITAAN